MALPEIDLNDYCAVCGEDTFVMVGETPACLDHFKAALDAVEEAS